MKRNDLPVVLLPDGVFIGQEVSIFHEGKRIARGKFAGMCGAQALVNLTEPLFDKLGCVQLPVAE